MTHINIQGLGNVRKTDVDTLFRIWGLADKVDPSSLQKQMNDQYTALMARGATSDEATRQLRDRLTSLLTQAWVNEEMRSQAEDMALEVGEAVFNMTEITYLAVRQNRRRIESLEQWRLGTIGALAAVGSLSAQVTVLQTKVNNPPRATTKSGNLSSAVTVGAGGPFVIFSFKPLNTIDVLQSRKYRITAYDNVSNDRADFLIVINAHTVNSSSGPSAAAVDGFQILETFSTGAALSTAVSGDSINVRTGGMAGTTHLAWTVYELKTDERPDPTTA